MRCPNCGKQNADDEQICGDCSYVLRDQDTQQKKRKPKTSRMAIASGLMAGLSTGLLIFVKPTLGLVAALLSVLAAISSIAKIGKSKGKLIGKSFAIAVVIFSTAQIVLLSYWRIDAEPVPNDYTISDISSAAPEYNQSYELLNSLADENGDPYSPPAMGLSQEDVNNLEEIYDIFKEDDYGKIAARLEANAESIMRIWKNAEKGREVISKLNTFTEIADRAEPDLESDIPYLKNLRRLAYLYRIYVCLQSCQGNEQVAIDELTRLDSVFRKLSINSRSTIMRLVCFAGLANDIMTANFIANNPHTSQESLEQLAKHFTPLDSKHVSLRNAIIFEYLTSKTALKEMFKDGKLKYLSFSPLKLNSTMRVCKNFCERWLAIEEDRQEIEELSVWPALYPKLPVMFDSDSDFPWYYKAYNPIGSLLMKILMPALDRTFEIRTKLQIHSDLFAIVLNKRLDRQVSLKARAYSEDYMVDVEKKVIFSPGLDGKPYTKDDIKLIINLDVLKWAD